MAIVIPAGIIAGGVIIWKSGIWSMLKNMLSTLENGFKTANDVSKFVNEATGWVGQLGEMDHPALAQPAGDYQAKQKGLPPVATGASDMSHDLGSYWPGTLTISWDPDAFKMTYPDKTNQPVVSDGDVVVDGKVMKASFPITIYLSRYSQSMLVTDAVWNAKYPKNKFRDQAYQPPGLAYSWIAGAGHNIAWYLKLPGFADPIASWVFPDGHVAMVYSKTKNGSGTTAYNYSNMQAPFPGESMQATLHKEGMRELFPASWGINIPRNVADLGSWKSARLVRPPGSSLDIDTEAQMIGMSSGEYPIDNSVPLEMSW